MDIITVIKDLEAHGTGTHADGKVNTLDGGTILETVHAVKEREMPGTGSGNVGAGGRGVTTTFEVTEVGLKLTPRSATARTGWAPLGPADVAVNGDGPAVVSFVGDTSGSIAGILLPNVDVNANHDIYISAYGRASTNVVAGVRMMLNGKTLLANPTLAEADIPRLPNGKYGSVHYTISAEHDELRRRKRKLRPSNFLLSWLTEIPEIILLSMKSASANLESLQVRPQYISREILTL